MMKKNVFYYLFAAICATGFCTSCSDDDDEPPFVVCPIENTTYTSENGLSLTYNGEAMLGKSVNFAPNGAKATLTLSGAPLDWGSIVGGLVTPRADLETPPTAPGVFPGSVQTTIETDLTINGDECSFAGEGESDYCTFAYEGKASKGSLQLALKDVKLKDAKSLTGTWKTVPFNGNDANNSTAHIVWKSEAQIELTPGWGMDAQAIIQLALRLPMIGSGDNKKAAEEMLNNVLQSVTFQEDGNIVAQYVDVLKGGTAPVQSPKNIAQYVIDKDQKLLVFLNPQAIMAIQARAAAQSADLNGLIKEAMSTILPWVVNGIPLGYIQDGSNLSVFLDHSVMMPLLKLLGGALKDEELVAALIEAAKGNEEFGSFAPMLPGILESLQQVIEQTTQIEIGINMTAAN